MKIIVTALQFQHKQYILLSENIHIFDMQKKKEGIPWLGFCTSTAQGTGWIPGWGTKILQAMWHNNNNKNVKQR